MQGLSNFKLGTLAGHYKLGDYRAHRACDDARVLAGVLVGLLEGLGG
jgi:DNA polymerase-3 subunit alpha (Gram-positive type)